MMEKILDDRRRIAIWSALIGIGWMVGWVQVPMLRGAQPPGSSSKAKKGQESTEPEDSVKSTPAALTRYADAANYQNNGAYELAADEWIRFLKQFPDDPLVSKAQHYLGVCQLQLDRFSDAAASFRKVIDQWPKFEMIEDSYLNLGWCLYSLAKEGGQNKQYESAAKSFEEFLKRYPKGKFADQAWFFEAESYYALEDRKRAAMAYGRLVTQFPKSSLRCDALYALGVTLEEMNEWKQAAKSYDMFLDGCADSQLRDEVRMRRAETKLQLGDVAGAEKEFGEVAAIADFESADHALFRQAFCAARSKQFGKAGTLYATISERFPKSTYVADARLAAGQCHYRADQLDEATSWFEAAIAAGDSGMVEAAHWLCRIHLRRGVPDQAVALADKVLPKAGESQFGVNLQLDRADGLYDIPQKREEALKAFLAIYEQNRQHALAAQALYDAAFAALELKHLDQATDLSATFEKEFPEHALLPDARYVAAECQLQTKDYAAAEQAYRQLIESASKHSDADLWRVRLGLVLYLQQKHADAMESLLSIVPQLPSGAVRAEAQMLIGLCQFRTQKWEPAIESLKASLSADARWAQADETHVYLARAQAKLDRYPDALETLAALGKGFPKSKFSDQAAYYRGEFLYAQEKFADAVEAYATVQEQFPESPLVPYANYGTGWALIKTQKYEPAINQLGQVIHRKPQHKLHADALFARGMCLRQTGKFVEAEADLSAYLATGPQGMQLADARYELGLAEVGSKKLEQAIATFHQLLKETPDYSGADKVLYELGWAYLTQSKQTPSAEAFAQLAKAHPDSPLAAEASFHVGEDHYASKKYPAAADAYRQTLKLTDDPTLEEKTQYKLGWALYQQEKYSEALEQFKRQVEKHPDADLAADSWFMQGECLFREKKYSDALPPLLKAVERNVSSPQIAELARLHAAQSAGQLEQWKQSAELATGLIEQYDQSTYLAEAFFERGRAFHQLEDLDKAKSDFREAADRSRGAVGARALFMLGEVLFQQKQHDEAIKSFQRVMFRAPASSDAAADVGTWQAKAGYEAGRCAEVQIGLAKSAADRKRWLNEARRGYQFVVDRFPKNELAEQAKLRLGALRKQ